MEKRPKRLLDQVRDAIRRKHYSIRTEQAYVNWIRRYILFHDKRHPDQMGRTEIEALYCRPRQCLSHSPGRGEKRRRLYAEPLH